MHPALWQLIWFDTRGSFRTITKVRGGWRKVLLALLMLLFVGFFISMRTLSGEQDISGRFGPAMPFWSLIYLLATWLTASADRGLVMRPAEIHFVVGGPFRDRDVITLNLLRLAMRALISASVLSLIALAYVDSYLSALLGMWLLISVSLLVGMIASLSMRKSQRGWIKQLRRVLTVLAIATLLLLISQSLQALRAEGVTPRVSEVAAKALETPIGSYVLPPLRWMFAPLASPRFFPDTLQLVPARLAVIGVLVGLVYLLGGRFLEASTRRTDVSLAKRRTAMRSGVATNPEATSWTKRISLPQFGRWGGIGSVAWMQMVHSIRVLPRFLVFTVAIVGVVLVIPLMVDQQRLVGWGAVAWMTGLTAYADFLLLLQLPVGFLGPIAQREMLKSLPIPSWRIVFGQLAGPVIPIGILHLVVTGLFLYLAPGDASRIVQTSIALIPAAVVLIANINLLGVWGVIRPRALQQRDALAAGRAMASVWIFFLMLTPSVLCGIMFAFLTAIVVEFAQLSQVGLEDPGIAYLWGASAGVLVSSVFYIALLARNFRNWQPSAAEGGKEEAEYER